MISALSALLEPVRVVWDGGRSVVVLLGVEEVVSVTMVDLLEGGEAATAIAGPAERLTGRQN
jgi:hypothetical protein